LNLAFAIFDHILSRTLGREESSMDGRNSSIARWSRALIVAGAFAGDAAAQPPDPPGNPPAPGDATAPVCTRQGRLHRMLHHTARHTADTLQDDFIGYPENFIEPPLGAYVNRQFAVQVSKADAHRFSVYNSDFLPETDRFSPIGASRFNLMYGRLPAWSGPIFVEWTPDQPELAESRRRAILATLASAGRPIPAERVVIGPSPYPGAMGVESIAIYNNTLNRTFLAAPNFPLPPTFSSTMGVR
jgi:hypothetical protein